MVATSSFDTSSSTGSAPRGSASLWVGFSVLAAVVLLAAAWWGHESAASIGARTASASVSTATPARPVPAAPTMTAAAAATPAPTRTESATQPQWPIWEFRLRQPIPPREPSLTPPGWRLVGAVQNGGQWRLIIQTQGKPEPQFLKVGDTLPGGARIVAINEEDVTLQRGARQLVLSYIGY